VIHGRRRVVPGDVVPLTPLIAHTHLFDAASGRRL
jgi:multiple sugar transport system ATP-binding protein